jgi:hypothetical protein
VVLKQGDYGESPKVVINIKPDCRQNMYKIVYLLISGKNKKKGKKEKYKRILFRNSVVNM